tara:strand:+ start:2847 stop:3275 length:429 start_codon:yes stop_codon:yes gene_type:complete
MNFEPEIWGPHYWFFLHTIAESYPLHPTTVTKKKYYDLMINFPLFIPNEEIGNKFSQLLDKYPVSPYLDSRESFVRWMHFIHNKLNTRLGKEELSMPVALESYRNLYKPKKILLRETILTRKHIIHFVFIVVLLFIIYLLYK